MDAKICCTSLERRLLGLGICVLLFVAPRIRADEPVSFQKLGAEFSSEIRPILNESCMKCHSTDEQKGTLDLEQFEKIDDVRRSTKTWLKVAEMLDNGEMPPKDAPQPTARAAAAAARLGRRLSAGRVARERRRPRPGRAAPAEQRGVHIYAAGFDGRRSATRPRVPRRQRRRRRLHQHRQRPGHVAGPALEIPRRRQEDRQPRRAAARRHSILSRAQLAATGPTRFWRGSAASTPASPTPAAARR